MSGNVEIGSQRVENLATTGSEGDTCTSALASTSTVPLCPSILGMVIVS